MIKITIDSTSGEASERFDKDTVIIGDGPKDSVDICFPSEGLHHTHLKIILKEKEYWVINQANDPFIALNGQPFGKKKLGVNDILQIRGHKLKIENIYFDTLEQAPSPQAPSEPLHDSPQLNALIEEAYNLENHKQIRKTPSIPKNTPSASTSKRIIKITVLVTLGAAAAFALIFLELYFRAITKIDREEMLAAESISDYAMALQYAKVYHIAPQKQNWVDPQFLKNNLVDLLSTTSLPCGNIDAQGQFSNCPYILRFYTNRDFSRFLLIAQPDATFTQWIIPKKTLIVDSSLMEVRKTDDLKILNRLLSYPTPLDGANGDEVKRAILQTEVIALEDLSRETGKKEFSPPSALRYIKPGAENLIYNAPRYHQFGETFLIKALLLSEEKHNSLDMSILQSELNMLSRFHDLIFYSSDGIKQAIKGYKALQQLVLPSNFFTGYLIFSKTGKMINSRLIIDNELPHVSEEKNVAEEVIAEDPDKIIIENSDAMTLTPLLREKAEAAQEEISPIIHNIFVILEDVLEKDSLFLPPSIQQLIDLYQIKQETIREGVTQVVDDFRKTHPKINEMMIDYKLREYGLLDFYNSPPLHVAEADLDQDHWNALQRLKQAPFGEVKNQLLNSLGVKPFQRLY